MRIWILLLLALGVPATVATLAGCSINSGSSGPQDAPVLAIPHSEHRPTLASRSAIASVRADRSKSWMDPNAKNGQLLYVSDAGTDDVVVYHYPSITEAGVLTGFDGPQGECVDKAGDVWIANTLASNLLEYAHGGTSPIASLSDPGQFPVGCSVNTIDGTLAASNVVARTRHNRRGSISLYPHAVGAPTIVFSPSFKETYFLSYDEKGNLFLDGYDHGHTFQYGELPSGSRAIDPIALIGATIHFPGGVGFAGGKINVGDQEGAVIYQVTEAGTVTGSTALEGSSDCVQFFVHNHAVICPDAGNGNIEVYNYPIGGSPIHVTTGLVAPTGAAVSNP